MELMTVEIIQTKKIVLTQKENLVVRMDTGVLPTRPRQIVLVNCGKVAPKKAKSC